MKVLALDTALHGCSDALLEDARVLGRREDPALRAQAEQLLPLLTGLLDDAGMKFADLDLIAVTIGPGSFAGLRVGLAAARGLALASGRPLVGVSTLAALAGAVAAAESAGRTVLAAIDAGRGEVYVQWFGDGMAGEPQVLPAAAVASYAPAGPLLLVGSGGPVLLPSLSGRDCRLSAAPAVIDAVVVGKIAAARGLPPPGSPPPRPLYIRAPDARLPELAP